MGRPMTIWKFPLKVIDEQTISLTAGYRPLHIAIQHGKPCLWVAVDPGAEKQDARIRMIGTGHPITDYTELDYIGTFSTLEDSFALVFHVFLKKPDAPVT